MKKFLLVSLVLTILLFNQIQAHYAELIVNVYPYNNASRTIVATLYKFVVSNYDHPLGALITSGQQYVQGTNNNIIYIDMINSGSETYASGSIFPGWSLGRQGQSGTGAGDLSGISRYFLVIYSTNSSTKHYLNMDINISGGADVYYDYIETSEGNWTLSLNTDERGITVYNSSPFTCNLTSLTVKNSFGQGLFYYDGIECTNTTSAGVTYYLMNNNTTLNIQAVSPQTYGYTYYFKNWNGSTEYLQASQDVAVNGNLTFEANFYYYSNLGLYTSFESVNNSGYFLVNNTTTNTNTSISKRSDSLLTFTSQDQEKNSMIYTFDCWKKNWAFISSSSTYSFQPTENANYTLNLRPLKPSNTYRNLQFRNPDNSSPTVGSNIRINWNQHPHDSVDYQVWRKVKHNGVWGSPTLIASLNHNATYYIDYEYVYTDGYTDDMLDYDVRAHLHYFGSHSYSDIDYETTFGKTEASIMENNYISTNATEIPENYSMANYPNPFNPTTTISYQLPEKSFVTIKVFDILGKEVATLVNENKPAGYYSVNFNVSNLTSGVYIYTISANGVVQSKKMLLAK